MRDRLTVTPAQYWLVATSRPALLRLSVITGAAVRLTDSVVGCSNWPKCGGSRLAPLSTHALIEFGNRAISGIVGVLTVIAAVPASTRKPFRSDLVRSACRYSSSPKRCWAFTVHERLAPGFVMAHFGLSMLASDRRGGARPA